MTLRSHRVPVGGPLLEPERPGQVKAEGANPFRKQRRDRSEVMHICPQQVHESSTNASSFGGPDTEDNDCVRHSQTGNDRNQEDKDGTAS